MNIINVIFAIFWLPQLTHQAIGLNTFYPVSSSMTQCTVPHHVLSFQLRGLTNDGSLDPNTKSSLQNIKSVGLKTDLYTFVCRGKDPVDQINSLMDSIPNNLYDSIWVSIDLNGYSSCLWNKYPAEQNCSYLKQLVAAIEGRGKSPGIRASKDIWTQVFGSINGCQDVGKRKLWYVSLNGSPSFQDFVSFGGFKTPDMKTYDTGTNLCGIASYAVNYY